jgi:hypothetical protein
VFERRDVLIRRLAERGYRAEQISFITGVSAFTVREWFSQKS